MSSASERILLRSHSPDTAKQIFEEKIQFKGLQLLPKDSAQSNIADGRSRRRARRITRCLRSRKDRPMSAAEKRKLMIYRIPKHERQYDTYVKLHQLWYQYIRNVLALDKIHPASLCPQVAGSKLASADLHGAKLEVVRSRCVSRIGLCGIVVRDQRFVFELITTENRLITVPKENTVFKLSLPVHEHDLLELAHGKEESVPVLTFELYGTQWIARAPDRATKKQKTHIAADL